MKIDRRDPRHWGYLFAFGANALIAAAIRLVRRRPQVKLVVFYGHKLNGNLLPIYRRICSDLTDEYEAVFLSLDPDYCEVLRAAGERCVFAASSTCIGVLSRASAVITSHGLHTMRPLLRLSDIRFIDVWHGIPFKGFDVDDFRVLHGYDEIWVASDLHRSLYIDRYGFDPSVVHVTGYARTDRLVLRGEDIAELRVRFGAPPTGRLILFAPTWTQDAQGRSLYPFGQEEASFMGALSVIAQRHGATILMRAHLNSGNQTGRGYPSVVAVPAGEYPDTEGILQISDVLICDWSSIAFDFLLLERPTVFLDVPAPFRKGFSLGPEYRFGAVVGSLAQLLHELEECLAHPYTYQQSFQASQHVIRTAIYGQFADGRATERCVRRLQNATVS